MTQDKIVDTLAIQRLVGKVSNLEGNLAEQKKFFTRDVQLRIFIGDEQILDVAGIGNFEREMKRFTGMIKRSHYMNGQHVIDFLTKDKATGLLFCRAVHVTDENGREIITDHCIYCEDIYENKNGEWLIKARDSHYIISK